MEDLVKKPDEVYETPGMMHLKDWDYFRHDIQNEQFGSVIGNPKN